MLKNHTISATSVTVSPTPIAGFEAINLQDADRSKICKVSGSTMTITLQMNGEAWVQALMLTGLFYSPSATFRLKGNATNSFTNPDYDSGDQPAYPASFGYGANRYGQYGFGGYVTQSDAPYHRIILPFYLGSLQVHNFWELTITDPSATEIGIGLVGLCGMVEMLRNFSVGWKLTSVDTTKMIENTAGTMIAGRKGTRYDIANLDFRNVPDEDRWPIHNELKTLGKAKPWFLAMHPEDGGKNSPWTTLYGKTENYSGFTVRGQNLADFNLTFREMT